MKAATEAAADQHRIEMIDCLRLADADADADADAAALDQRLTQRSEYRTYSERSLRRQKI